MIYHENDQHNDNPSTSTTLHPTTFSSAKEDQLVKQSCSTIVHLC